MKKIILFSFTIVISQLAIAQLPEDFDIACASASFPTGSWERYNPPATPASGNDGTWTCTSNHGKPATIGGSPSPGMQCTGVYSSAYHLDTSYLISPLLFLTSTAYPGKRVFLHFDSRKENIILGGRLAIVTKDTAFAFNSPITAPLEKPLFGDDDSTEWVTHEVDLSNHIDSGSFYFAFRYTSTSTLGTAWYIDNISITADSLHLSAPRVNREAASLTILGNSTSSKIMLSFTTRVAGRHHVIVYDMMGTVAYEGYLDTRAGTETYAIDGLSLRPGMYCVKMDNDNTYGIAKVMIQ